MNSLAHFWTLKAFLPGMIEKRRGHLVSIASLAGLFGNARYLPYLVVVPDPFLLDL